MGQDRILVILETTHSGHIERAMRIKNKYNARYIFYNDRVDSNGDVAQMVERSLSMREVWGSIHRISIIIFYSHIKTKTISSLSIILCIYKLTNFV